MSKVILEPQCQFYDYFYIMAGSTDLSTLYDWPYNYFPPLAYMMYYFLWKINATPDLSSKGDYMALSYYDNNMLIFVVFFILQMILLCYCVSQCFKSNKTKYTLLLPTALVLSYPITCSSLQRGNSVLLTSLLLVLAWIWMDDENKKKQELALILIAIAASFKFVPAIMGLEYVRRKDWKKVIRLVIYGLFFVFVPFALCGGVNGILALISNLTSFTEGSRYGLYTVKGAVEWFALKLFGLSGDTVSMFGTITQYIFLIVCIVFAFISKKSWQRAMFYAGIMASFLSTGWMYTCVYYLPAVILFLKEYQNGWNADNKVWVIINTCLWAIVFSIPLPILWGNKLTEYDGIYFVLYVIMGINAIELLVECIKNVREMRIKERY
ncbi:MAG: glycosyltransferase 87 family protein [Lachnospiraceae bacterium]